MKSGCDNLFMKTTECLQAEFVAVVHLAERSFVEEELKENTRKPWSNRVEKRWPVTSTVDGQGLKQTNQ